MELLKGYNTTGRLGQNVTDEIDRVVRDKTIKNDIMIFLVHVDGYLSTKKDISIKGIKITEITQDGLECYYLVIKTLPKPVSMLKDGRYIMTQGKSHIVDVEFAYSTQSTESTLGIQITWSKQHLYREDVFDHPRPLNFEKGTKRTRHESDDHPDWVGQ